MRSRKIRPAAVREQRAAEHEGDDAALAALPVLRSRRVEDEQRQRRRRQAARGQAADDAPFDGAGVAMHQRAAGLGRGGVEQVGADRRRGMDAEQQDEQRRHQRAAADAGHADQRADDEARKRIERIDRVKPIHGVVTRFGCGGIRIVR